MDIEEFHRLWIKYLDRKASEQEITRLLQFIRDGKGDAYLKRFMSELDPATYQKIDLPQSDWDNLWRRIQLQRENQPADGKKTRTRVIDMFVRYGGWAAAVAIVIAVLINNLYIPSSGNVLPGTDQRGVTKNDVDAPTSVNAVLTLANGTKIALDSIRNGEVATQAGVGIIKMGDGRLRYNAFDPDVKEMQYNTLSVPRGSKIVELILGDGSLIVLNAASSITYPTAFTGTERMIQMTGEVYFEIAKNKSMPFIVKNGETRVEVLGTHFNVNAYDDEDMINVTLIEGSVKVSQMRNSGNVVLKPGQAAHIDENIRLLPEVDIDEAVAWKSGKFKFGEYANIGTVMRQISRWYDVSVEYDGEIKGYIGGTISREANVSQVLELLQMTGIVKFKYDGKKITVMQSR